MRQILPENENPILRSVAKEIPVSEIGSDPIRALIRDMKKLLKNEEYGVALAAPQVGESVRLFIVSGRSLARAAQDEDDESEPVPLPDQVYINPQIVNVSRKKLDKHEGCLSVRGKWGMVPRAEKATVRAYDENGAKIMRGASGFLAHIFQHEMDHLEGILYTDKAVELYEDEHERA
ncbi:MAG: peptide deformylase [Candidatus Pacebacteria bacterium]|nr:peptide deformylase [Candidatus Paceibacterota bacterium]